MLRSSVAAYTPEDSTSGWDTPEVASPTADPDLPALIAVVLDEDRPDWERLLAAEEVAHVMARPGFLAPSAHQSLDVLSRLHRKGWLGVDLGGRAYSCRPVLNSSGTLVGRLRVGAGNRAPLHLIQGEVA